MKSEPKWGAKTNMDAKEFHFMLQVTSIVDEFPSFLSFSDVDDPGLGLLASDFCDGEFLTHATSFVYNTWKSLARLTENCHRRILRE